MKGFEIYRGKFQFDTQWYWRYRAKNGKIIADGAEGYSSKSGAARAVKTLLRYLNGKA